MPREKGVTVAEPAPDAQDELRWEGPLSLPRTAGALSLGRYDPVCRVSPDELWRTSRTPDGPATLHVELVEAGLARASAWGEGASWLLGQASGLLGLDDDPVALDEAHPELKPFARAARGLRLARYERVVEQLVPIVLGQLITGVEAHRAYCALLRELGEAAPGPLADLRLPLAPAQLKELRSFQLTPLGVLFKQGATLVEIGRRARRLEEAASMSLEDAHRRLCALPGIGPWTAGNVLLFGLGHADAIPIGDYHLPDTVAYNLSGQLRADDERMLELLEPYRGQRGRALRWIVAGGMRAPRMGPRRPLRRTPNAR